MTAPLQIQSTGDAVRLESVVKIIIVIVVVIIDVVVAVQTKWTDVIEVVEAVLAVKTSTAVGVAVAERVVLDAFAHQTS